MDRLLGLEPSNTVMIRIEPNDKCFGQLTLKNVMHTMPVGFRLEPKNTARYAVRPQSGIISPLSKLTVEIVYLSSPSAFLEEQDFIGGGDGFLLHSVVVPGAAAKDKLLDAVPMDWFTTRKKQVFVDSGIRIKFVGSVILAKLVMEGAMDEVREVLERSDPGWRAVDSVDSQGQSLLHLAVSQSRPDLVQLLLEFDPNVNCHNRSGASPLETATSLGDALIVELLLARRALPERSVTSQMGPIHLAAGGGHVEVLRLLLLKGVNVNSLTKDGDTALHLAVRERRRDCARLLLASGARPDSRNTGEGETALHIASGLGDEHMVKLLLQKGANKEIRNKRGKTAYDVAAEEGHGRLFDALRLGDAFCLAARKGDVKTVQRLIENGVGIDGKDQNGWTGLHRAAFKGKTEVVRVLIGKGADLDAKDEDGYSPLHCAVESGFAEVVELLLKRGADVEARTNRGVTALQIAQVMNYPGIARILTQNGAFRERAASQTLSVASNQSGLINGKSSATDCDYYGGMMKKKRHNRNRSMMTPSSMSLPVL
uniref:MSP domain-containing protein n=1 Tax=Kalanchoe fedtschenkoi TaxID=63787 RepID=A0A7N0V3K9_KALFE